MFKDLLWAAGEVEAWRNIENLSISAASGMYRSTNYPYKLTFVHHTGITPSTLQNDDIFLSLVYFQTIQS